MQRRDWRRRLSERARRDSDERERAVSLLAVRDGFGTLLLLLCAVIVWALWLGPVRRQAMAGMGLGLLPLLALLLAGGVTLLSWWRRGGSMSREAVAYGSLLHLAGTLLALVVLTGLTLAGILPFQLAGLLGTGIGLLTAIGIITLLQLTGSSRRR